MKKIYVKEMVLEDTKKKERLRNKWTVALKSEGYG